MIKVYVPWETRFAQLLDFKTKHGHCRVPKVHQENPQLAGWVKYLRQEYRKYQKEENSHLVPERIGMLEDLGFDWKMEVASTKTTTSWQTRYEQLVEYKDTFGHCRVSMLDQENLQLASWVKTMRRLYKKYQKGQTRTSLTKEKVQKLDDLGFEWELRVGKSPRKASWETHIEDLKEYKKLKGHCRVPRRWKENQSLAIWVSNMRQQYIKLKKGEVSNLNEERIVELEDLGFEWIARGHTSGVSTRCVPPSDDDSNDGQLSSSKSSCDAKVENLNEEEERSKTAIVNEKENQFQSNHTHHEKKKISGSDFDEGRPAKKQRRSQCTKETNTTRSNRGRVDIQKQIVDNAAKKQSKLQEVTHNEPGETLEFQAQRWQSKFEGRRDVVIL